MPSENRAIKNQKPKAARLSVAAGILCVAVIMYARLEMKYELICFLLINIYLILRIKNIFKIRFGIMYSLCCAAETLFYYIISKHFLLYSDRKIIQAGIMFFLTFAAGKILMQSAAGIMTLNNFKDKCAAKLKERKNNKTVHKIQKQREKEFDRKKNQYEKELKKNQKIKEKEQKRKNSRIQREINKRQTENLQKRAKQKTAVYQKEAMEKGDETLENFKKNVSEKTKEFGKKTKEFGIKIKEKSVIYAKKLGQDIQEKLYEEDLENIAANNRNLQPQVNENTAQPENKENEELKNREAGDKTSYINPSLIKTALARSGHFNENPFKVLKNENNTDKNFNNYLKQKSDDNFYGHATAVNERFKKYKNLETGAEAAEEILKMNNDYKKRFDIFIGYIVRRIWREDGIIIKDFAGDYVIEIEKKGEKFKILSVQRKLKEKNKIPDAV